MKLWAKCLKDQHILSDVVREFPVSARPTSVDVWNEIIIELCKPLDLSCPVLMKKHLHDFLQFNRAVFYPADFMESVNFDRFEIEIFPEKKKDY